MNNENKAIFKCGWNTPRKVLEENPASPVKNQAHENEPLSGSKKFRVRQGMPEFRLVEEGVRGISSSLPMKQESCTGSNPDGWNYVYKSQELKKPLMHYNPDFD